MTKNQKKTNKKTNQTKKGTYNIDSFLNIFNWWPGSKDIEFKEEEEDILLEEDDEGKGNKKRKGAKDSLEKHNQSLLELSAIINQGERLVFKKIIFRL